MMLRELWQLQQTRTVVRSYLLARLLSPYRLTAESIRSYHSVRPGVSSLAKQTESAKSRGKWPAGQWCTVAVRHTWAEDRRRSPTSWTITRLPPTSAVCARDGWLPSKHHDNLLSSSDHCLPVSRNVIISAAATLFCQQSATVKTSQVHEAICSWLVPFIHPCNVRDCQWLWKVFQFGYSSQNDNPRMIIISQVHPRKCHDFRDIELREACRIAEMSFEGHSRSSTMAVFSTGRIQVDVCVVGLYCIINTCVAYVTVRAFE